MLLTSPTPAAVLFEPLLAYQAGKVNDGPAIGKSTLNGATYGGKIGYTFGKILSGGVEADYATLVQEYTSTPHVYFPATHEQVGLYGAADFLTFRAAATFFFFNQVAFSTRDETLRGTAVKLGLSVPIISNLRISADYVTHFFQDTSGTAAILPVDASTMMLSLSYVLSTKD